MLNKSQQKYTNTEKEILDVVFAVDKFSSYNNQVQEGSKAEVNTLGFVTT